MRKTSTLPRVAGIMPQRRPVFIGNRPRFVTRPDWRALWALVGLGAAGVILGAAAFLLACTVLL